MTIMRMRLRSVESRTTARVRVVTMHEHRNEEVPSSLSLSHCGARVDGIAGALARQHTVVALACRQMQLNARELHA